MKVMYFTILIFVFIEVNVIKKNTSNVKSKISFITEFINLWTIE